MSDSFDEGTVTFSIKGLYDLAGNAIAEVTSTTDGSSLIFDKTPPVISNTDDVEVYENNQTILTISATDTLSGIKADSFGKNSGVDDEDINVDRTSGVVTFVNNPDYEFPADSDKNNVYNIQIAVDDKAGNTATKDISVTVKNKEEPFIITVEVEANENITIPTNTNDYSYNYNISWGDNTAVENKDGDATHTYENAGTYDINITGTFPQIYFNNKDDNNDEEDNDNKDKFIKIKSWGDISWSSMSHSFEGCSKLYLDAPDIPVLKDVTDLSYMFANSSGFDSNNIIEIWDTSTIENMDSMFREDGSFTNHNLSKWNVDNVTNHNNIILNAGDNITLPEEWQ